MFNNRSEGVPDQANSDASQDMQGFEGSQTQQPAGGNNYDAVLAQIQAQLSELRKENLDLKRQVQSQGDKLSARLEKKMRKNAEAVETLARIEGWDEATQRAKLQAANQEAFASLGLDELKQMTTEPEEPRAVTDFTPTPAPPAQSPYDAISAYAQQVNGYIQGLGLTPADFGPNGITEFVVTGPTPQSIQALTKRAAKILEEKENLAKQAALHQQRKMFAEEVGNELEQSGGLGGTIGNAPVGATASRANAERMIQEELKQFRGTGQIVEALELERQLRAKYGLPQRGENME
jgi:predicted ribosome quality control (RQC) complex YloA/Tae2 family protein